MRRIRERLVRVVTVVTNRISSPSPGLRPPSPGNIVVEVGNSCAGRGAGAGRRTLRSISLRAVEAFDGVVHPLIVIAELAASFAGLGFGRFLSALDAG